ncbi:hypothetical protein AVEN_168506-1 [Araneus ventricosus]|uniref:Uncharacterized protein n=1 Tax=Araneus ventricosus TaxID=182803 RepID=A0A4Y2TKC3_ARAVE|nr:hypothetical protein AVEN_168506-1 [Araneus ventricosus]
MLFLRGLYVCSVQAISDFEVSNVLLLIRRGSLEKGMPTQALSSSSDYGSHNEICGEEKSVNPNEVTDWIGKLKSLLKGYDDRDIFIADETGSFTASFRTRPYVLMVKMYWRENFKRAAHSFAVLQHAGRLRNSSCYWKS